MDSTLLLAIYGAVLGTLGFVLSLLLGIREYRKEKRILKVILEYVAFYEHLQIRKIITNFRPITIVGVGGQLMTKSMFRWIFKENVPANVLVDLPKPEFPITLKDGESVTIKLQAVMFPYFENKNEKLLVYAYDAEGQTFPQTDKKTFNAKYSRYEN